MHVYSKDEIQNLPNMSREEERELLLNKIAVLEQQALEKDAIAAEKDAIAAAVIRESKKLKYDEVMRKKKEERTKKKLNPVKRISLKFCRNKLNWWRGEREHQWKTAKLLYINWMKNKNRKFSQILKAVPKSGKREIAEIISLMLFNDCYNEDKELCFIKNLDPTKYVTPIHITGFNRKDCKAQLKEMRDLGFYSEAVSRKSASSQLLDDYIQRENITEENIGYAIVFIDEADYASGKNMKMEPWINEWKGNAIFVSATPEEVIAGYNLRTTVDDYKVVKFEPSPKFKDKRWFYEQNLIHTPEPFTYITNPKPLNFADLPEEEQAKYKEEELDISYHGKKIIFECQQNMKLYKNQLERKGDRNHGERKVVFVRKVPNKSGSYSNMKFKLKRTTQMKTTKGIIEETFIDGGGIEHNIKFKMLFVDGTEKALDLDKPEHWERECQHDCVIVIFVCNSASRSTELAQPVEEEDNIKYKGAHYYLYAFHDERKLQNTSNYNTIDQAIGRTNHYDIYGHPIKLYVCALTCMIEAEIGDWKKKKDNLPNISSRCNKRDSDSSETTDDEENKKYSHLPTKNSAYNDLDELHSYEKKKRDIIIEKYNNPEEAKKRIKEIFKGHIKNDKKYFPKVNFNRKKNDDGFYLNKPLGHNVKGVYRPMSYDEIVKKGGNDGVDNTYKAHVCYENLEDPNSICYVICFPKSLLEQAQKVNEGVEESKSGE
jgi:hypothetical protein